jgi:hypothetical protein
MSFGLLSPLALALSALVALPILAHLSKQIPREKRIFGAMLLLERVVKRLRRRRRLKDKWLLWLRGLAVLLVILAAAGLQFHYPGAVPEFGGSGRVVLLIDRSMSMSINDGGSTLLGRAREEAAELLSSLPDDTLVGLVAFDSTAERMTQSLTTDHARVLSKLKSVEPTYGSSNLRAAIREASSLLGGETGEVILYSDEAGPRMVGEAVDELSRLVENGSSLIPIRIQADPQRNVAVTSASYGSGIEGGQVTLRITNYGPIATELACEVSLPDGATIPIFADLPPNGEAEERITVPREALGGVGSAICEDPDLPSDDAVFFHLPRIGAARVLVVDGDPGDTPTRSEVYFLERALAPWGGLRTGVTLDVTTPIGLMDLDHERHRVVFLANVADPRPFGPRLTEFVRKGGNLVIGVGDNVSPDVYNAALSSILPAPFRKVRSLADPAEQGVALELPDVEHPLFTAFKRSGRAGFARVRSHRVMTLEPYEDNDEVTTLLRYEGGMPALVERRIGSGRVLIWTSSLDIAWSGLPLQSVYMPLLQRMVIYLGGEAGGSTARFSAVVGERVEIPLPELVLEPVVLGPDKSEVPSHFEGSNIVFYPERPGAYELHLESAPPLAWVAVNTDPLESDVRIYDSVAAVEAEIHPELFQRSVDLGRGLLGFALLLLAGQAFVSLRGLV